MKRFLLLAALSSFLASAEIIRNAPIPDLFDQSDTVFLGQTVAVQPTAPAALDAKGKSASRDWVVVLSVLSLYKGTLAGASAELVIPHRNALWGIPAAAGMNWLVFAHNEGKTLTLVDDQAMLPFWRPPATHPGMPAGLARIESDLLATGFSRSPDSQSALETLFRFPGLGEKSIEALRSFDATGWDAGNIVRLELIARQGSASDIDLLLEAVAGRDVASIPASDQVFGILLRNAAAANLPAIEQMCDSDFAPFRLAAMNAIRRLALPAAVPFLIGKLRSPDQTVAYETVIALSEITGRHELGASMPQFEKSPEEYLTKWEKWWAESGASQKY